ncbi:sulfatase [Bacteroidia bacterium]|nr:sulfatase [Bacteroidia bacterium]
MFAKVVNSFHIYKTLLRNISLMLLLFMLCRLLFFLFNRHLFPGIEANQMAAILVGGLRFDLSALAWGNIAYIALFVLPAKFRYNRYYQSVLKYFFITVNSILLFANCCDFIYFRFTLRRTTFGVFKEFADEQNFGALIAQVLIDYWYVALIWMAMTAVLVLLYRKAEQPAFTKKLSHNVLFYALSTVALAVIALLCVVAMRGGFRHSTRPITLSNAGQYVRRPLESAIVQNTSFCIFRTIGKKNRTPIRYFANENELELHYNPLVKPASTGEFRPMNVVIIIWESFAKEYVGALNKDLDNGTYKGYTPFVDSLIGKGLTFTYSYANGRKSIDGLPSVLASIPSEANPFVLSPYSGNYVNSLGSLLKTKGYSTSFFHGAPNGSMGFWGFLHTAGFDKYYGKTQYANNRDFDGIWGIWDEEFLQFFANKLGEMPQPFCSAVFTLSSHHPFKLPQKHVGKFTEGAHPLTKCISYSDYALRRFFETAQKQHWYSNTLFVITADHANQPLHAEYETSVGQMSVPVIYFTPNGELRGVIDHVTQQTDIMPTVLSYLNFDQPYIAFGQNALDTVQEHTAINYINGIYQVFQNNYVLLFDGVKTTGLYDLQADRLMRNNLSADLPEIAERLALRAKAFIQQYNSRMIENRLVVVGD